MVTPIPVLDDVEAAARAVLDCRAVGLDVSFAPNSARVDGLAGRPSHVILTPDQTVATTQLLRNLAEGVRRAGVAAVPVGAPADVGLHREDGAWTVRGGDDEVRASNVVVAAGPAAPSIVAANVPGADVSAYRVTSTTVLSVAGVELPGAIVSIPRGPHVIPHRTSAGRPGFTVCVPFDNQPSTPEAIHRPPVAERRRAVLSVLEAELPGLADIIVSLPADDVQWYSCQKLASVPQPDGAGWRYNTLDELAEGLWLAYAGKFTTAPLIADEILSLVCRKTGQQGRRRIRSEATAVPVAARPFDEAA